MKDAYYFPHDSNARNDEKCSFIISKYGMAGYGLYWVFVENMHQQQDGKLTCKLLNGLAFQFNVEITMLSEFYNDAIEIELFVTDGVKYWSDRVLRNKQLFDEKKQQKSEAGIKGMQKRWGNRQNNNTVITDHNTVITENNKGKERKLNESKEEESKEEIPEHFLKIEFADLEKLKNTRQYIENCQQLFHISENEVFDNLDKFWLEKQHTGELERSQNEVFGHFKNWLKKQNQNNNGKPKIGLAEALRNW